MNTLRLNKPSRRAAMNSANSFARGLRGSSAPPRRFGGSRSSLRGEKDKENSSTRTRNRNHSRSRTSTGDGKNRFGFNLEKMSTPMKKKKPTLPTIPGTPACTAADLQSTLPSAKVETNIEELLGGEFEKKRLKACAKKKATYKSWDMRGKAKAVAEDRKIMKALLEEIPQRRQKLGRSMKSLVESMAVEHEKVSMQLKNMENSNAKDNETLKHAHDREAHMKREIQELRDENKVREKDLAGEVADLRKKNETVLSEFAALNKQAAELKVRLDTAKEREDAVEARLAKTCKQLEEAQKRVEQADQVHEEKLGELRREWEARLSAKDEEMKRGAASALERKEELNSELVAFRAEKQELVQQVQALQHEVENDRIKLQGSVKEAGALESALKALQARESELQKEVVSLRAKLDQKQSELGEALMSFTRSQENSDQRMAAAEKLRESLSAQLLASNQSREEYLEKTHAMDKSLAAMTTTVERLEEHNSELMQAKAASMESEKELRVSLSEMKAKMTEKEKELYGVNVRLKTLEEVDRGANVMSQIDRLVEVAKVNRELQEKVQTSTVNASELEAAQAEIAELKRKLFECEQGRRKLHNEMQELRGNIRVMVRVRPFLRHDSEFEASRGAKFTDTEYGSFEFDAMDEAQLKLVGAAQEKKSCLSSKNKTKDASFKFDHIFRPGTTQSQVFKEVSTLVQSALDGFNVCLFSYGQTGSGKTYTMQGGEKISEHGIIPRAVRKVLEVREKLQGMEWEYDIEASFLEIYNETVRDLLTDQKKFEKTKLSIQKASNGKGVHIPGLVKVGMKSESEVEELMKKAASNRSVASTKMNADSSRSHSVFTLWIKGRNTAQGIEVEGTLHLVDLAGSERLARSKAEGERLKETQNINKSLATLGNVFRAIRLKQKYVPFRDSKLTYLLQSCFTKDGKTLMFVNLSPTKNSFHETQCSLQFAQGVSQVELGKASKTVKRISGAGTSEGSRRGSVKFLDQPRKKAMSLTPNRPALGSKRAKSKRKSGGDSNARHKRTKST